MRHTTPVAFAAVLLLSGCGNTGGDPEEIVSGDLARRVASSALMAAALASEIALSTSEPPGPGGCPSTSLDGDDLSLDYGAGCVPDSGITADAVGGSVSLIVAGGMGAFIGDLQTFGFDELPLVGEVSGDASRAGDLLAADIDFPSLAWTSDGEPNTLDSLFELEGYSDGFLINGGPGLLTRGATVEVTFELEDVTIARGSMGACFVPDGGTIRLQRFGATATLEFTPEVAEAGSVSITFNDRDEPETLPFCP